MSKALRLYNSLSHSVEPFVPADPSRITFYTCGPTVYDDAHIGNFRSFLAADLLRRWIESPLCVLQPDPAAPSHQGPRSVVHMMNITDVGHMTDDNLADGAGLDKMDAACERISKAQQSAKKSGTAHAHADLDPNDPRAIARFYEERFIEDAKALGLKLAHEAPSDPSLMPRASAHVQAMIQLIQRLIERDSAYVRGEQGHRAVYFDVQSFPDYGTLSGNTLDHLRGGAGGRVNDTDQAQKKHPADFLLWKEDPSHLMKWPSPWGEGYPGWHIECSAMALERLITGGLDAALNQDSSTPTSAAPNSSAPNSAAEIDLHSGGEDNIFPHHECEIAQSRAATGGSRFARHWFHARFLMVEGQKMSKSTGNFFTARDLFAKGHSPAALRLELISTHYRANANFTEQGLKDAARQIERWRDLWDRGAQATEPGDDPAPFINAFANAMHDDLNIAGALAALNEMRSAFTSGSKTPGTLLAQALATIDDVIGVITLGRTAEVATEIGVYKDVEPDARIETLLAERREARNAKDWAAADRIRDELAAQGLSIKDAPGGKVEVSRT